MRLIDAKTLVEKGVFSFVDYKDESLQQYAILSHRWIQDQEVTYNDCNSPEAKSKTGYDKILQTCTMALSVPSTSPHTSRNLKLISNTVSMQICLG